MSDEAFFSLAAELTARREPFATATVVRAERPTSAKSGSKAIVAADGTLHGWIGGSCSAPVVRREALSALAEGAPRLIVISNAAVAPRDGVRHFPMTCHSGGELEIYIEPILPREQLVVVGHAPVARGLVALASDLGMRVVAVDPEASPEDVRRADALVPDLERAAVDARTVIVIATRGEYDEDAVRDALATPARYIALVASRARGGVLVEDLAASGVPRESLARLRYPAGLDIGARSEEEIALSILAEVVVTRGGASAPSVAAPREAVDPVCGMVVAITADALSAAHEGTTYYFCSAGCKRAFERDPGAVLAARR